MRVSLQVEIWDVFFFFGVGSVLLCFGVGSCQSDLAVLTGAVSTKKPPVMDGQNIKLHKENLKLKTVLLCVAAVVSKVRPQWPALLSYFTDAAHLNQ